MKRVLLIGIIFLCISCLTNSVEATKVNIDTENKEIKSGETFTVKLSVKDIDIEEGINAIQGKLKYDKNVFEKVESQNITFINSWSMAYNDEDTDSEGKFVILKLASSVKEDEDLIEIKLKAKSDIKSTKTNIELQELCTVDGDNIVGIEDSKVEMKVQGKFSIVNMIFEWFKSIFRNN